MGGLAKLDAIVLGLITGLLREVAKFRSRIERLLRNPEGVLRLGQLGLNRVVPVVDDGPVRPKNSQVPVCRIEIGQLLLLIDVSEIGGVLLDGRKLPLLGLGLLRKVLVFQLTIGQLIFELVDPGASFGQFQRPFV